MDSLILLAVIAVLSGLLAFVIYDSRKERNKLIQAVMSKSAQDLKDFELAEKITIQNTPNQPSLPDLTAIEDLSDDDYKKFVLGDTPNA